MNVNQKRSLSLKKYWENANKRKIQLRKKMEGQQNPAKLSLIRKKISNSKLGKHLKHN